MSSPDATIEEIHLCSLDELSDPGSREFSWGDGSWPLGFFVVRQGFEVFAYHNRCPHAGNSLNLRPDRFLTSDGRLVLCQSHGARFSISDGLCVFGPCLGAHLSSIELTVRGGEIFVSIDELERLKAAVDA